MILKSPKFNDQNPENDSRPMSKQQTRIIIIIIIIIILRVQNTEGTKNNNNKQTFLKRQINFKKTL